MGDYREGAPLLCERCEVYWHASLGFDCWNCDAADDVVVRLPIFTSAGIYTDLGVKERDPLVAPPGLALKDAA